MPVALFNGEDYVEDNYSIIGRDKEMSSLFSILSRKTGNNCLVVGQGGVGTSTLLKMLQSSKKLNTTPTNIRSKRFYWLDVELLFAIPNQDEINKEFNKIHNKLTASNDNVLIIENVRGLIEGVQNTGSMNIISSIINSIQENQYQCIMEVHDNDLPKVLGIHTNIRDYFTMLEVHELNYDVLVDVVKFSKTAIEKHHYINIDKDALITALEVTTKFKTSEMSLSVAQPMATLNLLDIALSYYKQVCEKEISEEDKNIINDYIDEIAKAETMISQQNSLLNKEIEALEQSAQEQGLSKRKESEEEFKLRSLIKELEDILIDMKTKINSKSLEVYENFSLNSNFVVQVFSEKSKIPLDKLVEDEQKKLLSLEANLNDTVLNQGHVTKMISDSIITSSVGLGSEDKPQGSYLFGGSSGTGKTFLAKRLAYETRGSESSMIRFDMSEYSEKHASAKLIGAPPGYEGYEAGGILTNQVRKNPHSIILFDEVEKADPTLFDLFLQILDDGRLTDNRGLTVNFKDTFIMMTTNIGQQHFLDESLSYEQKRERFMEDLEDHFRPEFLNRFGGRQNIVPFNVHDVETIAEIARREIIKINNKLSKSTDNSLLMENTDIMKFCKDYYEPKHGARLVSGYFQSKITPVIGRAIISGSVDKVLTASYCEKTKEILVG